MYFCWFFAEAHKNMQTPTQVQTQSLKTSTLIKNFETFAFLSPHPPQLSYYL